MKLFFIADLHLFYSLNKFGIDYKYFDTEEERLADLRCSWNKRVTPEDTVCIAGDVANHDEKHPERVVEFLNSLNGNKILVRGNHDALDAYNSAFIEVCEHKMIYLEEHKIYAIISHFPMIVWPKQEAGSVHIYGRTHKRNYEVMNFNLKNMTNAYCVSYGEIGPTPMTIEELVDKYGYFDSAMAFRL